MSTSESTPNTAPDPVQAIALVAAFNRRHELLLLKRPDTVHCAGLWSFPGGKVEQGEPALSAAMRELHEETGLTGQAWRQLGELAHAYADRQLNFLMFACHCPELSGLACESEHAWVARDALHGMPMPEANAKLTPMLFQPGMEAWLDAL